MTADIPKTPDTPIRELVEGLNEMAALPGHRWSAHRGANRSHNTSTSLADSSIT